MEHPGTIRIVDADRKTEDEYPFGALPENIAFVLVNGVRTPIVRVVEALAEGERLLALFAGDGRLLRTLRFSAAAA